MKYKKGLEAKYVVTIIVLIVSFVVILIFYRIYFWKGEIDKQTCHQSVIYKATIPTIPVVDDKLVDLPLKCQTEKICITPDYSILGIDIPVTKGNCDADFLGETYQVVRISGDEEKQDKEINKIIADKLYECWWMMGEGKVQLYNKDVSENKICTICARIAFDEKLKKEKQRIIGYQKYLLTNYVPMSSKTYWMYLTNSELNLIEGHSEEKDYLDLSQKAIVFAELDSGTWAKWFTAGGGVVAGAAIGSIVPGVGTVVGAGIGGVLGYFGGKKVEASVNENFFVSGGVASAWKIVDYNITTLKGLKCTSFEGMV